MQPSLLQPQEFLCTLKSHQCLVRSRPGIPSWNRIPPSIQLLSEALSPIQESRTLILGGNPWSAALAIALSQGGRRAEFFFMDQNYVALQMAEQTLSKVKFSHSRVSFDLEISKDEFSSFQQVCMILPKGRSNSRRWLMQAWLALADDGEFFLSGAKGEGIKSSIDDAQSLFGEAGTLGYKKGHRVVRFAKKVPEPIPAWSSVPGIYPGTWSEFELLIRGERLSMKSLPGVFSFDRLDQGTELLLNSLSLPLQGRVLDMGCGYGIIGICAALWGANHVELADSDLLAVASARANITSLGLQHADAFPADIGPEQDSFDLILSNPPFHTGNKVDYQVARGFIEYAFEHLSHGGKFQIVANRFIPYDKMIAEVFGNIKIISETGKYWVLLGIR